MEEPEEMEPEEPMGPYDEEFGEFDSLIDYLSSYANQLRSTGELVDKMFYGENI
jgi:hypothetical protein